MRTKRFLEAARAAEKAADACGTEAELAATFQALRYMEEIQVAMLNAELQRQAPTSERRPECLPIRDEGDDIGVVQARIPKHVFFGLMQQKNFGWEGLTSDEGMRDVLKAYPQFGVKTVSGKTVVGYRRAGETGKRRKGGVKFGRGTLVLAD